MKGYDPPRIQDTQTKYRERAFDMEGRLSLMRGMVNVKKRTIEDPKAYNISNMVNNLYHDYLSNFAVKKDKTKRRVNTRRQRLAPFYELEPYTITMVGYLNREIRVDVLFDGIN